MKLELSKDDIEIISECILSEMNKKGNQASITGDYEKAIRKLLKRLEAINSYLCDQLYRKEVK